jgi:hypothetical protein
MKPAISFLTISNKGGFCYEDEAKPLNEATLNKVKKIE